MVIDNLIRKPCDDCKLIPEFVTEIRNRIKELDAQHKKHLEEEVINRIFSDNMMRLDVLCRLPPRVLENKSAKSLHSRAA